MLHLQGGQALRGSHLAAGRRPATSGLGLELAGVQRGEIVTDDFLRTTAEHVYAAGDCTSALQFTHVADRRAVPDVRAGAAGRRRPAVWRVRRKHRAPGPPRLT